MKLRWPNKRKTNKCQSTLLYKNTILSDNNNNNSNGNNDKQLFSAANLALAGFPLSNALGENLPSRH